jgi:hypothetical protein
MFSGAIQPMDSNQTKRLNALREKNHLSQKQFIISVLENSEGSKDYESLKGNFSKFFSGERELPDRYIIGVERTLHASWHYIIDGGPIDTSFEQKGLRYAAYRGSYHDFELLGKEISNEDHVIRNSDEYGNTILDYVLDYQAIEGLRYLDDNQLIRLGYDLKNNIDQSIVQDQVMKRAKKLSCSSLKRTMCPYSMASLTPTNS